MDEHTREPPNNDHRFQGLSPEASARQRQRIDQLLDELDAELGPVPAAELARARVDLDSR